MPQPVDMPRSPRQPRKPRGVFRADWTGPHGEVVLIARDSRGGTLAERTVPLGESVEAERLLLWAYLNWKDPVGRADERAG